MRVRKHGGLLGAWLGSGKHRFISEELKTNRPQCGCFSRSKNLTKQTLVGYTEVIAHYRAHLSFHAGKIEKFGACWTCYRHQKSLMAPGEYGDSQ